ncbi:MAG TPA: hypothetical protein VLM91_17665, partial [Candidatus Methylomirabilis sp.]|nr:hypothetical protein [Candidatus Methylomirabilis sp.]
MTVRMPGRGSAGRGEKFFIQGPGKAADQLPSRGAQAGLAEAQVDAHQTCAGGGQGLGVCELRMGSPEFWRCS